MQEATMHARHEIDDNARRKPSSRPKPGQGPATPASALLDLQRKLGNAAVADMIAQRSTHRAPPVEGVPIIPAGAESAGSEHGDTAQRPAEPAAVQRWAFVGQEQIEPDVRGLSPAMKEYAHDSLVHDYEDWGEFRGHTEGKTDYVGNLPGPVSSGTWVRFDREGTNVLGENHTKVTLPDVLVAVGSRSFKYEPFATDDFGSEPKAGKAERASLEPMRKKLGIDKDPDSGKYGIESIYPKMGYLISQLHDALGSPALLGDFREGGFKSHEGAQIPRYLKIAWEYGKDMLSYKGTEPTQERDALAEWVGENRNSGMARITDRFKGSLGRFIEELPMQGFIGDLLDTTEADEYKSPLRKYVELLVLELWARGKRKALPKDRNGRPAVADMGARLWGERDPNIESEVARTANQGTRYVGLGDDHRKFLEAKLADERVHYYDMAEHHLRDFEEKTRNRKRQAVTSW